MKTPETIRKQISKNNQDIENMKNQIESLNLMDARQAAFERHDFETVKKLRIQAAENNQKIANLDNSRNVLKIENNILLSNLQAALFGYAMPIISDILTKYNMKQYGPKTADAIKAEAKQNGFIFWFDGYSKKDHLKISFLTSDGFTTYGPQYNIDFYLNGAGITPENKINAAAVADVKNPFLYSEDTKKAARDILKAFSKYQKAMQAACKAQAELNAIMPGTMSSFYEVREISDFSIFNKCN